MNKILVIGHMDWQENHMSGAVIKARNIYSELIDIYGKELVDNIDIFSWKKKVVSIAYQIIVGFGTHKNIILVISDTSIKLMGFMRILNKIFNNNVIYIVVGGVIADTLKAHSERINLLDYISLFLVETTDCLDSMRNIGFTNTEIMRNFKKIEPVADINIKHKMPEYHFCTFSRVTENKGISQAIKAVEEVNEQYECYLDVYGDIDPDYETTFRKLLVDNVHSKYCGVINSNNSPETLNRYYCLLFPTLYQTEGIPGTIIDSFAASLPVICSNWCRCKEIIADGITGFVYPFGDYNQLVNKIIYVIENPDIVNKVSKASLLEFEKYKPETAILPLLKSID